MGKQKVTNDMETKMIELYNQDINTYDIGKIVGVSESTVGRYLNKNGIKPLPYAQKPHVIKKVLLLHEEGKTEEQIKEIMNLSRKTIRKILHKNNATIKTPSEWLRKYTINETYFSDLDHQNKYYILGFFYADGNVSKSDNNIQIALQDRDSHILESMRQEFESNRPLYFDNRNARNSKHQNIRMLSIDSEQMRNDLIKWGVAPNKTHIIKYPDFIPDEMQHHFLRGVMDGDGCIARTRSGRHRCRTVSICGTYDFCVGAKEIIEKLCGVYCCVTKHSGNGRKIPVYVITVSGIYNSIKFLNWIYKDAELYLFRKREIFQTYYLDEVS